MVVFVHNLLHWIHTNMYMEAYLDNLDSIRKCNSTWS